MAIHAEKLAILFADICGSTALYEKLGDDEARRQISRCISLMSSEVFSNQGRLVKTIGDEIMVSFQSAEAAFLAACAMQIAVENDLQQDGMPMHVRIGFNFGEVINDSNDIYGNAVNIAARVTAITRAGQIMATREVFDVLPSTLQGKMRQILRAEFKGAQERLDVYRVVCSQEDMQITRSGVLSDRKPWDSNEMLLRYRGKSIKVNKERRSVTLGRDEPCDVTVHSDLVSRLHSFIELRFGKFMLVDQSTNGTYVRFSDGSVQHITGEEVILHGSGSISLGESFAEGHGEHIEFLLVSREVVSGREA